MSDEIKRKFGLKKALGIPVTMGVALGFVAALTQALLISGGGPEAYGFCVACHTRDLANNVLQMGLGVAPIAATGGILTVIGVILGSYLSSRRSKEFKVKTSARKTYLFYTLGGVAVMCFALMLGACPYRAALRVGYGDWVALVGILAIFGGVALGAVLILRRMKKEGG